MNMPNDQPDLIKEYLDRLRIREKSADLDEYTQRLTHLARLRVLLMGLTEEGFAIEEGHSVLGRTSDRRTPDFLVLKEDVLFYVYLVLEPAAQVSRDDLSAMFDALRENQTLTAVVLVWATRDYPTLVVDTFSIRHLLDRPDQINLNNERLEPVLKAIKEAFSHQFVDWHLSGSTATWVNLKQEVATAWMSSIYSALARYLAQEKARVFEIPEKSSAQQFLSEPHLRKLADAILRFIETERPEGEAIDKLNKAIERLVEN